jgi:hypothetical protein
VVLEWLALVLILSRLSGLLAFLLVAEGCSFFRPMPDEVPIHHASALTGNLEAGAAAVDITPDGSVWMGGYDNLRSSRGVHDRLYARALVLRRGDLSLALVAVDLVGLQYQDILRIQERMQGIDPRHVVIASTHSHSGPDTLGIWGLPPFVSGVSGAYLEKLEAGILEALKQAQASLRPAELGYGSIKREPQGFFKNLRHPGLVDREIVVLRAREAGGGKTIATVVELGCHPEVLGRWNRDITRDFPHWTVTRLEEKLGGTAIYVSGALGALVTPDVHRASPPSPAEEWSEAERIGNLLADSVLAATEKIESYSQTLPLGVWHTPVYLPNRNWRYEMIRWTGILHRKRYRWGYFRTEVNLWQIGELRVATVPGEIEPSLGLRIKRAVGGKPTMIVGLANDELGYLLPQAEYELPIYSYERTLCPGFDSGERLVRNLESLALIAADAPNP